MLRDIPQEPLEILPEKIADEEKEKR